MPRGGERDRFAGPENDKIYPELERHEDALPNAFGKLEVGDTQKQEPLKMDADEDRKPRSLVDMEKEAAWLKSFFPPAEQP
jgi:bis(5'-adenosyl)-triphosphatase